MNDTLNNLLGLYVSTTGASIIMNLYINEVSHIRCKKKCMKNLKYRKGLHYSTKKIIRSINREHVFDSLDMFLWSLLPAANILYTYDSIMERFESERFIDEVYEGIIEEANENEDNKRKQNVQLLRNLKDSLTNIPSDIDLDDNSTRLTSKKTKKILKHNHISYKKELKKIEKGE